VITNRDGRLIAVQRPVTAGADENGYIEIKSGLSAGERIVADGLNKIQPDQPVILAGAAGPRPSGTGRGQRAAPGGPSR